MRLLPDTGKLTAENNQEDCFLGTKFKLYTSQREHTMCCQQDSAVHLPQVTATRHAGKGATFTILSTRYHNKEKKNKKQPRELLQFWSN